MSMMKLLLSSVYIDDLLNELRVSASQDMVYVLAVYLLEQLLTLIIVVSYHVHVMGFRKC